MTQAGPRRRPAAGGYARGDEKRTQIIQAALRRFGEDGYDGASTRQIAQDAGVNPPALQYYFSGKEGLYRACAEAIVEGFFAAMQDVYARADAVAPGDPRAAASALCDIIDAAADFLFETAEVEGWARFLARVQNRDGVGPIDQALGDRAEDVLYVHCTRLVGLVHGEAAAADITKLRTIAILGQLTNFHLEQASALRQMGWPDFRGARLSTLKAMLRAQTWAALGVGAR